MVYYLLLKGEPREALMYDSAILGETTDDNKKFYPNRGFTKLFKLANNAHELLEGASVYTDAKKEMSIEQFLKEISNCKIQKHMEE